MRWLRRLVRVVFGPGINVNEALINTELANAIEIRLKWPAKKAANWILNI